MKNLLSLHGLGCGGDTISLLNAEEPDLLTALGMLDINIAWHPSLSLEKGDEVLKICTDFIEGRRVLDYFLIEGAVPTSPDGSGLIFEFMGKPFAEWVKEYGVRVCLDNQKRFISGKLLCLMPLPSP